jgi:hypothetical protein
VERLIVPAPDPDWDWPRYGDASLPDLLPSALAALTGARAGGLGFADHIGLSDHLAGVRRIGVVLVDGLGYHLLDAVASAAATRPLAAGGAIADVIGGGLGTLLPLTAGFPSTTPVSIVGLGTGERPGAHGVVGFSVRVPGTGRVLNHIKWWGDPDPGDWQPVPTVFERAATAGVATTVVSRAQFVGSGLTTSAYRGAAYRGAETIEELAAGVRSTLVDADGSALVYGYHPELDHAGHVSGIASKEWRAAAAEVDRLVSLLASDIPRDTAILVTADHGQLDVPDDRRFDIDADRRLREGVDVVAGEPRVRYLHTAPGAVDDVVQSWRGVLGDAAWIGYRDEAVATGLYGPVPPNHLSRIGDVVVICRHDYVVVESAAAPSEARLGAYHGALTPAEMEIPLIVLRN